MIAVHQSRVYSILLLLLGNARSCALITILMSVLSPVKFSQATCVFTKPSEMIITRKYTYVCMLFMSAWVHDVKYYVNMCSTRVCVLYALKSEMCMVPTR